MRQDKIIEIFEANGCAMSSLRLAQRCIAENVFDATELNNASVRWVQSIVRDVLKAKMADGIPYAAPTLMKDDDGGRVWKQYTLWDYDDAEYILLDRCRALANDYKPIVAIYEYMVGRWGKAPEIPHLVLK